MKLINPTDDELNAAFAEKVAGWYVANKVHALDKICYRSEKEYFEKPFCGTWPVPPFTRSMNAVLPWLNAPGWLWHISNDEIHTNRPFTAHIHRGLAEASASDTNAPRACVIALLRANGVEVTFQ